MIHIQHKEEEEGEEASEIEGFKTLTIQDLGKQTSRRYRQLGDVTQSLIASHKCTTDDPTVEPSLDYILDPS